MLLPHNNEVIKPAALNTFLDGIAELEIDKSLIKFKFKFIFLHLFNYNTTTIRKKKKK